MFIARTLDPGAERPLSVAERTAALQRKQQAAAAQHAALSVAAEGLIPSEKVRPCVSHARGERSRELATSGRRFHQQNNVIAR